LLNGIVRQRASVTSTDAPNRVLDASVSSDRRAQRGSRFVGQGEDLNLRQSLLFASVNDRAEQDNLVL
jgi:hypothetical protein